MKKKKNEIPENYLEKVACRSEKIKWSKDEDDNMVTLDIENKGVFNKIAQTLFGKPRVSHVHLDELGSFIWQLVDGKKSISEIGVSVGEHFGDKAEPLYERLAQYFQILDSYGFIFWK